MARWEDALSEKHRIATWWLTDMGQSYGRNFHADVVRKDRPGRAAYVDIAGREAAKLKGADPVWVSDEVMDLVEAAADHESFRFEPIHAEDLFAESGFALLPRGRYQTDVNGLTVSFRAFSWGPDWRRWAELDGETGAEPALSVTLYTDWHDDIYLGSEEARPAYEDLVADRADALVRGNDPRDLMPGAREQQGRAWRRSFGSDLSMFHSAFIPWGTLPSEILDEEIELNVADEDAVRHAVLGLWSFIQAFFRLAGQRIVLRERTQGDRKSRRRMARVQPDNDGVLVVKLRRPANPKHGSGESDVDWAQRWIVGGHWRNQWYPSVEEHRQIWIAPHVKGPDDKPLVLHSDRVYEFVR
jgi:hypothetical protein